MIDKTTFTGIALWRMSPDLVPTFVAGDLVARIVWRPVAVCAWEIVIGDRGLCSLPIFTRADQAKLDAWGALAALRKTEEASL
jgi:hypothetical protein